MSGCKIVVAVTGSIAAFKACEVISDLVKRGHEVKVVATPAALKFVGGTTFEGLTGRPALSDLFAEGAALEHIGLTRWADGVLVCPATAGCINRLAAGLADDLLGALFLAHDRSKPFLVAPAMNPQMWSHPATAAAVETLSGWGVQVLAPASGRTACGETGEGRLAEPDEIVARTEAALARPERRLRVLVTGGGTSEPVDAVRVLSNTSTGGTGAGIADRLFRCGHDVTLLRANRARAAIAPCREELFETFGDLDAQLGRLLGGEHFDAVVHAAAVGDFSVESISAGGKVFRPGRGKLESDDSPAVLLRRNPKLVDGVRAKSRNTNLCVVAFKLTTGAGEPAIRSAVEALLERSGADFVVHNDLGGKSAGAAFPAQIHAADGAPPVHCPTREELALKLEAVLGNRIRHQQKETQCYSAST